MDNFLNRIRSLLSDPRACVLLLALLGITAYANCLPNEMFWDDNDFILNNRYIKDWAYLPQMLSENIIAGTHLISNYWRPLLAVVFSVQWHLWGDWVYGWHAVSVTVQIADSILLFFFLRALLNRQTVALLTAAMFLIHPASNEAVVYANSLGDGLANLFVFGGLLAFVRFRQCGARPWRSGHYALALLCYPLALFSKETGILLAAYLLLTDYLWQPAAGSFWQKISRSLGVLWPFFLTAAGYLILRATVFNVSNSFNFYNESNAFTSSIGLRLLTFCQVMANYAGFLFVPYDLRVERVIQAPVALSVPHIIFGAAFLTSLIVTATRCFHRRPVVTYGILWFFVGILPTSNLFVVINAVLYEHFLFTALAGIWLAVFWLATENAVSPRQKQALTVSIIVLFTVFTARVLWRNTDWRTSIRFYEKLTVTAPNSYRVMNNLGMSYAEAGRSEKAESAYKKAMAIDPNNAVAYHNLANIYLARNERDKALAHFKRAIDLQENFIFSYKPLAQLYLDRNDLEPARILLEKYYNYADDKALILNVLIQTVWRQNDWLRARQSLNVALSQNPNDPQLKTMLAEVESLLSGRKP